MLLLYSATFSCYLCCIFSGIVPGACGAVFPNLSLGLPALVLSSVAELVTKWLLMAGNTHVVKDISNGHEFKSRALTTRSTQNGDICAMHDQRSW